MIKELKESRMLAVADEDFRWDLVRKMNEVITAVNEGIVHENKVAADRAVEQVYTDLPLPVTAAMMEEEYNIAMAELGLETEV